jgi:DNA primase
MLIRGIEVPVDVMEELDAYEWYRSKTIGDDFMCCSPFRNEKNPSFGINLVTGLYNDFGGSDDYWKKGNLVKLLAFLNNESYEEVEDALLEKYGFMVKDTDGLKLELDLNMNQVTKTFTRDDLRQFFFRHDSYLRNRKVSETVEKKFCTGYDKEKEAIAFFWQDIKGDVVTVKFRSIHKKQFRYIKDGQPVKNHIYGLYHIIKDGIDKCWIVESEIDCLYLWSIGIPAIALGGSSLSREQEVLLKASGITELTLAFDNDKAGYRITDDVKQKLGGYMELYEHIHQLNKNDVNEESPDYLLDESVNRKKVGLNIFESH